MVGDQRLELDRLDVELVAARGNGLLSLALQRIRGHAYDRDVAGLGIVLEGPHGFPAVQDWHFEVHQNYVRALGRGQPATLLTVLSREDLEIPNPLKARLEHIEVVVIVFDVTDPSFFRPPWLPHHSITSSALVSSVCGTVRPSVLAVWLLTTNSNLSACMTGMSAGLLPLRIRPA